MSNNQKSWTEYYVRCRRWARKRSGQKFWETVILNAADEEQALKFYRDIKGDNMGVLENPVLMVREIVEYPYKHKKAKK